MLALFIRLYIKKIIYDKNFNCFLPDQQTSSHIITDKKNNCIKDEELDKVSGGAILQSDREWADKQLWPFIENEGSWTDVVESVFPKLEAYCSKVNAAPGRTESYMNIIPRELDEYMMARSSILAMHGSETDARDLDQRICQLQEYLTKA